MSINTTTLNHLAAATSPIHVAKEQHKPAFSDSGAEYRFYAANTDEKKVTGEYVAAQTIEVASTFVNKSRSDEAFTIYESGMGAAGMLYQVLDALRKKFPKMPVSVIAKEYDREHVVEGLQNLAPFFADTNFSLTITNMRSPNAPTLRWEKSTEQKQAKKQFTVPNTLTGTTEAEIRRELWGLRNAVAEGWKTSEGDPVYQSVLQINHKNRASEIAKTTINDETRNIHMASIAHAWRLAQTSNFKANVIKSSAEALVPGIGKAIVIQACGGNTGHKIIREIWNEATFNGYESIIEATRVKLGNSANEFTFETADDLQIQTINSLNWRDQFRLAVYASQMPHSDAKQLLENGLAQLAVETVMAENDNNLNFSNQPLIISR